MVKDFFNEFSRSELHHRRNHLNMSEAKSDEVKLSTILIPSAHLQYLPVLAPPNFLTRPFRVFPP